MAHVKIEGDILDTPSRLPNKTFDFVDPVENHHHHHHHGSIWPQTNFQATATRNLKPFSQNINYWSNMNEVQNSSSLSVYMKMENDNVETMTGDNKNGIFDGNTSSRSSSPIEGQHPSGEGTDSKQKVDSKICGVCGDKALGNNFNAITCESCKAFFRRNALKPKDFVCPFSNNCKVDPVTRRFCQKCRLKKCFDIGMKKEWIMTDEEKKIKKQKIEQNRLKRQSSDVPLSSEVPLAKAACMVEPIIDQNMRISQNSPPDPTLPHKIPKQPMMPHNEELVQSLVQYKESPSLFCLSSTASQQKINMPSSNGLFCTNNNGNDVVPVTNFDHVNGSNSSSNTSLLSESSVTSPVGPTMIQSSEPFHQPTEDKLNQNELYVQDQMTTANNESVWSVDRRQTIGSNISSQTSGIFTHKNPNVDTNFEPVPAYQTQMPLLSSLIRPGVAESPPDIQLTIANNNSIDSNMSGDLSASSPFVLNGQDSRHGLAEENHHFSSVTTATGLIDGDDNEGCIQEQDSCDYSDADKVKPRKSSCVNPPSRRTINYEPLPLPLNTMDSIIGVAINAEFNACGVLSAEQIPNSRHLNKAEQNKLNELLNASRALNTPVDVEGHDIKVSDPSLINVINLTDIAIRRLIKMSKKISGFKNMCQDDQVALLKGSCTEMMILRSVVAFDPDRDSWNIPHSKLGYNIKLGVLKAAKGNLYEEHQRFVKSFKSEWRCDDNVMIILCAITLFTSERPNVIHKEVVKLEQDSYYYLLKRYLESKLNGCEARSTYLQLIKKIAELHELNSNHLRVFLEVNPREVEPLLIEIFDLK